MRPGSALISVLAGAVAACAASAPSRLGYAPPSAPPTPPALGYVGRPSADLIWNQLLDRLSQSGLRIDLADQERGVMVASYSGDAAPYVTCGSILRSGEGGPEQIDASGAASFERVVQGRPVEIDRDLKLDARLAVEVTTDDREAFVKPTANYVLTKTVVAEDRSGRQRGRAREIVSFSTGERGAFRKGTVCQPNGALERTVLDIVAPAAQVAQADEPARPMPTRQSTIVETELASDALPQQPPEGDGEQARATSDLAEQPAASDGLGQQAGITADVPERPSAPPASDDLAPQPSECAIADQTFCSVLEITDPYRQANEVRGLGLEMERIEGGNPLVEGSDLGLDISMPNYDAYLAVSYFLRDGTVYHALSGRNRRWPANAREFVGDAGLGPDQIGNVEMVVAVASDVPLFTAPRPSAEAATSYLADLRRRLDEMSNANDAARIAASLLVITASPQQPS